MVAAMVLPTIAAPAKADAKLQAALIAKLLPYYKNISGDFTIHVVGADDVASNLKGMVGKKLGNGTLAKITTGATPTSGASVVYVGSDVSTNTSWTQANKALSITGDPNLVNQGVTLGIGIENNKPKIFLNLTASKAEGADWNPTILKVAETLS